MVSGIRSVTEEPCDVKQAILAQLCICSEGLWTVRPHILAVEFSDNISLALIKIYFKAEGLKLKNSDLSLK